MMILMITIIKIILVIMMMIGQTEWSVVHWRDVIIEIHCRDLNAPTFAPMNGPSSTYLYLHSSSRKIT